MNRVNFAGRIADGVQYVEMAGLSTDTKPTEGIMTGSSYLEIDTGDVFLFDEESGTWIEVGDE